MSDRDITESLKSFTGLHVPDVSDAYFLSTRVIAGKERIEKEDREAKNMERCGHLPVRNVREHNQAQPAASPITDAVFWHLLATWPAAREHPRWRERSELRREVARLERRAQAWQDAAKRWEDETA